MRPRLIRLMVVAVSGAKTVGTAVGLVGFDGRSPGGSPNQKNRKQANRCGQLLSGSDRKVGRWAHLDTTPEYCNRHRLSYSNPI